MWSRFARGKALKGATGQPLVLSTVSPCSTAFILPVQHLLLLSAAALRQPGQALALPVEPGQALALPVEPVLPVQPVRERLPAGLPVKQLQQELEQQPVLQELPAELPVQPEQRARFLRDAWQQQFRS